jgi:hypothetical protein
MNQDNPARTLDELWERYKADPYAPAVEFIEAMQATDWDGQDVEFFREAAKLAFFIEQTHLLRDIVRRGHARFPDDEWLAYMDDVLTPKPARLVQDKRPNYQPQTNAWFKRNAHLYRRQWVALQRGNFLEAAPTYEQLADALGATLNEPDIFITRVL